LPPLAAKLYDRQGMAELPNHGSTVAVGIVCKTPSPGQSKTRLCPPLQPHECAELSACFIRYLSRTVGTLARRGNVTSYAVYTPAGSEDALRPLLPEGFRLMPQIEGPLGARLIGATASLLEAGHRAAILLGADSPTLPLSILGAAVDGVVAGDNVVLSPALDGGYTLVGLSRPHPRLFEDIPWSTDAVYRLTLDRAQEIALPVVALPGWYDVDNEASLRLLQEEFQGRQPALAGAEAPATRAFLARRWIS
jgi:rSAM/selenodomain-associated transferase 1